MQVKVSDFVTEEDASKFVVDCAEQLVKGKITWTNLNDYKKQKWNDSAASLISKPTRKRCPTKKPDPAHHAIERAAPATTTEDLPGDDDMGGMVEEDIGFAWSPEKAIPDCILDD